MTSMTTETSSEGKETNFGEIRGWVEAGKERKDGARPINLNNNGRPIANL